MASATMTPKDLLAIHLENQRIATRVTTMRNPGRIPGGSLLSAFSLVYASAAASVVVLNMFAASTVLKVIIIIMAITEKW